jgi:predicted DNA-binding WGR domain protein
MNELSCVTLRKVDSSKNMARQYSVAVCRDLFGTPVVVCRWGRIGRAGRSRQQVCASLEDAQALAEELVETRRRRGYSDTGTDDDSTGGPLEAARADASPAPVTAPIQPRRAQKPTTGGQLWLLDWTAAQQTRVPGHKRASVTVETAAGALPADAFALMRRLGKPATSAERERAMSILTLAASLRGIALSRGALRPSTRV